jgi:hypothetical protein
VYAQNKCAERNLWINYLLAARTFVRCISRYQVYFLRRYLSYNRYRPGSSRRHTLGWLIRSAGTWLCIIWTEQARGLVDGPEAKGAWPAFGSWQRRKGDISYRPLDLPRATRSGTEQPQPFDSPRSPSPRSVSSNPARCICLYYLHRPESRSPPSLRPRRALPPFFAFKLPFVIQPFDGIQEGRGDAVTPGSLMSPPFTPGIQSPTVSTERDDLESKLLGVF